MGADAFSALKPLKLTLVGAPSFSVFVERPRFDQVFNLRRMFTALGEMEERGIPVFPNVFVGNEADVSAWAQWLDQRPNIWMVGVVVQHQPLRFFDELIRPIIQLQKILTNRRPRLHVILYGVGAISRAVRARALGLRYFVCVSSNAAMMAAHGRRLDWTGSSLKHATDKSTPIDALLDNNIVAERLAFRSLPVDPDGLVDYA